MARLLSDGEEVRKLKLPLFPERRVIGFGGRGRSNHPALGEPGIYRESGRRWGRFAHAPKLSDRNERMKNNELLIRCRFCRSLLLEDLSACVSNHIG
jgi:hypothetical protein